MTNERKKRVAHSVDDAIIKENVANSTYRDDEKVSLEKFANRLNEELQIQNISQEELAEDIHISTGALSNYRTGNRFPDARILVALSEKLKVSLDYLFGITDLKSTDIEDKVINEKTSLNDESIKVLAGYTESINYNGDNELYQVFKEVSMDRLKAINYLIQKEDTTWIFSDIAGYLWLDYKPENEIPALTNSDSGTIELAIENRKYKREFETKDLNRIPIIKIEEKLIELKLEENKKQK